MTAQATHDCRTRYPALIDRAFVRSLGPRTWRRVQAHAHTCAFCRRKLDRLGQVDAALSPGAALAPRALARAGAQARASVQPLPGRAWWWPLSAGVAAAAAVAVLLLVLHTDGPPDDRGLRPRGHPDFWTLSPGQRQPGVRLFCVDPGDSRVLADAHATILAIESPPLPCMLGGELQLAYSTPDLRGLNMVAFGRDSSGRTYWYAPRAGHEASIALSPDRIDETLDWSTRLEVKHTPGIYDVHVRFYDHPVLAEQAATDSTQAIHELRARLAITE